MLSLEYVSSSVFGDAVIDLFCLLIDGGMKVRDHPTHVQNIGWRDWIETTGRKGCKYTLLLVYNIGNLSDQDELKKHLFPEGIDWGKLHGMKAPLPPVIFNFGTA